MTTQDRNNGDDDTYETDFPDDHADDDPAAYRDVDLVTVLETSSPAELAIAESLLAAAEIPYLARGAMIQDLFGLGRLTTVNPITGPVAVQVDRGDEAAARELLADVQSDGVPADDDSPDDDSADDEPGGIN